MTDEDVNSKFAMVCEGVMPAAQCDALRKLLWGLDTAANMDAVFELSAVGRA